MLESLYIIALLAAIYVLPIAIPVTFTAFLVRFLRTDKSDGELRKKHRRDFFICLAVIAILVTAAIFVINIHMSVLSHM